MSRRFEQPYRCRQLRELTQHLHYAPADRKAEQVYRAEQLHDEIEPDAMYPVEYLAYRITRYRVEREDDTLLVGAAVRDDLRLLIDELSRSIDLPPRAGEMIHTLEDWARKLNVSRKTLERWRKSGLRWRWFVPRAGAARQVGITAGAVERFRASNERRMSQAARYAPLDAAQRDALLEQAKRMKAQQADLSLHQAAVRLARQSGRSVEAMRKLLEKRAVTLFPDRKAPLSGRQKRLIARATRMGVSTAKIASYVGKSRYTVHRAVQSHRAWLARQRKLDHVKLATFDRPDADEVLLGHALPDAPDGAAATIDVTDLPAALRPFYKRAGYAERTLRSTFVRYNYVKFSAERLRAGFDAHRPRVSELDRFESLAQQADHLRDRLAAAHLPVVLSVVKRHLLDRPHTAARLVELLKIGHGVLFEALESYDPSRPRSFDAYLRNRLLHRLANEPGSEATRAHRRIDDAAALRELIEHARRFHVNLT